MKLKALIVAALLASSAHAAITGIVPGGPGGSNLEVQFSSAGAFKGVTGSRVDSTTVTFPARVNAASFSGAVLPAGVDLSTVTTRFALVGAATGQLRIDADKVAIATTSVAVSTTALKAAVDSLAASTTTLSASTVALVVSTTALGVRLDSVAVSTTNLAAIKASTGTNSDITALTGLANGGLKDGVIYGQDIAASTVPLAALNQSGATDGQAAAWSTSLGRWTPTTFTAGLTHGTTEFFSTNTWTTPAGVTSVMIWGCAAGASGGNGGGTVGSGSAGGGGAGETIFAAAFTVTPGAVNNINMGAAGVGVAATGVDTGNNGNNGGDLIFANAMSSVTAQGGRKGLANSGNTGGTGGAGGGAQGGAGGVASAGAGAAGTSVSTVLYSSGPVIHIGGAGGGGGGNNANGGIGGPSTLTGNYLGGVGTSSGGAAYAGGGGGGGGGLTGAGGNGGGYTTPTPPTSGSGYCSGGGGGMVGSATLSGAGAPGYIRISW